MNSHVSAASLTGPQSLNYVLKHNLLPHLGTRALLAKSLITTDSVKSGTGPLGAGQSQIAFPQSNMPGWHRQLGMKAG